MSALSAQRLGERALVLTLGGDTPLTSWGANCLAVWGREATLVVDPLIAPAHARLVLEALAQEGLPPVRHVAVTHHHTDHALGAGLLAARGAEVWAHRRCAALMAAQHPAAVAARRRDAVLGPLFADAEPHQPARCFDEAAALDLGGLAVELRHLGPGHTPGDAIVWVPALRLLAAGDLLFEGYHYNYEEADAAGLEGAYRALAALGARTVVPGHGPAGGPERIAAQRAYHAEASRLARAAPDEAAAAEALRARWPGRLLDVAVPGAAAFWRGVRRPWPEPGAGGGG